MSINRIVDNYIAMWNEEDAGKRAELIREAWRSDGSYLDPKLQAGGYDRLSDMVDTVHHHYPGHRFARLSEIDGHHNLVRFAWHLAAPDGSVTVTGLDVGEVAGDGRLQKITGFFGELPEKVA
jgi:hypothetical protein